MEQSRSKKPIEELSDSIKELSSDIKQIRNDLSYIKSKIKEEVVKEKVEKSLAGEEPVQVEKRWWW
jgi:uncharacterized coiled-coil protein SlyX